MLPGFVDAHSHFSAMMQMASGLDLDDPSRPPVTDVASLQAAIRSFIDARAIPAGGWVVVWQYDDQKLAEKRHITRAELDAVSADRNIVVLPSSLHSLVANSAPLEIGRATDARDRKSTRLNYSP